jgi:hypothetical protein
MNKKLESIEKRITAAEKSYAQISSAWLSAEEVSNRIESLLVLAKELRAAEGESK